MVGSKTRTSSIETVATSWYKGPMGEELSRVQEKRYLCGLGACRGTVALEQDTVSRRKSKDKSSFLLLFGLLTRPLTG